jgi:hypothetical protein
VNTTAISRRSATWQVARVLGLVIILSASAALGVIVGSALQGDDASGARAGSITAESSFSMEALGALHAARDGVAAGAPTYADPYREYATAAAADTDEGVTSATRPSPR